jgi:chemotaxis protein histidine kinase CheA
MSPIQFGSAAVQTTKQQQILGYFIEEAKEHLDAIEHGLLDLKATMGDAEEMNHLFRAAHSIKGGAAMLGFDSIQRVGHHLEDYFKILKDNPVAIDRRLEDLFLKGFDSLKALIEELQGTFGLREEEAAQIVKASEPVFAELGTYLNTLIKGSAAPAAAKTGAPPSQAATQVNQILRVMLQLFKQGDNPKSRQQLSALCARLIQISKESRPWVTTLQVAQQAIGNPKASYPALAPLVIKELKQASDLLLTGRAREIMPSRGLQLLAMPKPTMDPTTAPKVAPPATVDLRQTVIQPIMAGDGASHGSQAGLPATAVAARPRQISIPAEPKAAARALLDNFNKAELIQLAEFLMKAIQ